MHILNNSILAPRFSQLPRQGQADATGLPTGEVVAASNGQYVCSVTAYDAKGRAALVSRTTLNGKVETSKFTYNYKGDVASTVHQVTVSGNKSFSSVTTNGYDGLSGKLSSTTEAVSYYGTSASATVAKYGYDGLGRLLQVMRSGRAGASSYTYDLHGWPTGVKSKAFEESGRTLITPNCAAICIITTPWGVWSRQSMARTLVYRPTRTDTTRPCLNTRRTAR